MCSLNERLFPYLLQSQLKAAKQTHFTIINFPYHHQIANEKKTHEYITFECWKHH